MHDSDSISSASTVAAVYKTDGFDVETKSAFSPAYTDDFTLNSEDNHEEQLDRLAKELGIKRWRLQMKIDLWILLPICLLYLLAFLDRVNISNANAYGMSDDINLKGNQFNIALAVFFVPYIIFEIPANFLLKKMSPHVFLPLCLLAFGGVSIGQGFVKNYHELIVTRVLLGLLETAMFPACFYLLGCWYTRTEAQKRYSFFFCSTSLAGAFGGLIAYGVHSFSGKFGIEGWRWIFIVEGSITGFCGLLLFFLIADFPEQARFLNDKERIFITKKIELDVGKSSFESRITLKDIFKVLVDWRVIICALSYFGCIVGGYGYAYFSVAIIKTFGYSALDTQVHSIYPWIATFGCSMIVAILSDISKHRYLYTLGCLFISVAGYGMLLGTSPTESYSHVRYAACFLIVIGLYSAMPLIICWANMNFAGHSRKMVASAFQVGFANTGGIISVFVYRSQDAPGYRMGIWVSLALLLLTVGSTTVYFICLVLVNNRRNRGDYASEFNALSEHEQEKMGDLNPSFRYMY